MPRAIVTTDLGFGDSGKGTCVDALVRRSGARLVVRYNGGPQAAHHVVTDQGLTHCFASFGSGALAGASTLLTRHVLVDPYRLMNEREVLTLKGATPSIYVDDDCLVITPFHAGLNRLREVSRGNAARHGSCGVGVGETVRHSIDWPGIGLRVRDLSDWTVTRDKLVTIRDQLWNFYAEPLGRDPCTKAEFNNTASVFKDDSVLDALLWRYHRFLQSVVTLDSDDVSDIIRDEDTVWEGAQGVLLDEDYGFHPFTTWSHTTPANAHQCLSESGITDITTIGILRAYGHRHGPGPFPSQDEVVRQYAPESHNVANPWQGDWRVGWFDAVLADYAKRACGGRLDGIALTHLDRLYNRETWPIVTDYGIDLTDIPSPYDWNKRQRLTDALMTVRPEDRRTIMVNRQLISQFIGTHLNLPVIMTSSGQTASSKTFL